MGDTSEQLERPYIVGIGGTTRPGSSTERILRAAMEILNARGARTELFAGPDLCFPPYAGPGERDENTQRFLTALRLCNGLVIATPSYHGSMSGLLKNAIDYTEDMRADARIYFDGLPVGSICCAGGWQAASHTLAATRAIIHSLRGWPTPIGVIVNTSQPVFGGDGKLVDSGVQNQLQLMADQIMTFAKSFHTTNAATV